MDGGWRVEDLSEYNCRLHGPTGPTGPRTQISNNADVDNDGAY